MAVEVGNEVGPPPPQPFDPTKQLFFCYRAHMLHLRILALERLVRVSWHAFLCPLVPYFPVCILCVDFFPGPFPLQQAKESLTALAFGDVQAVETVMQPVEESRIQEGLNRSGDSQRRCVQPCGTVSGVLFSVCVRFFYRAVL